MKNKLADPKFNIILIFIFEIIGCAITFSVDYSGGGMAAVITKWVPAFIGLGTIIIYFGSLMFTKKYNWIITLVGIVFILIAANHIYQT